MAAGEGTVGEFRGCHSIPFHPFFEVYFLSLFGLLSGPSAHALLHGEGPLDPPLPVMTD